MMVTLTHELTAVGQTVEDGRRSLYEMGWSDIEKATDEAAFVLASWGLTKDDHVLFVQTTSEYLQVLPWQRAVKRAGAVFSCSDIAPYDASRTAMFVRLFSSRLVIGLNLDIATVLVDHPEASEIFGARSTWLVRPDALDLLRSRDIDAHVWQPVGPGSLASCRDGSGLHLVPSQPLSVANGAVTMSDGNKTWQVPGTGVASETCSCGLTTDRVTNDD